MSMRLSAVVLASCVSCSTVDDEVSERSAAIIIPPGTPLTTAAHYVTFEEAPALRLVDNAALVPSRLRVAESAFIARGAAWLPERVSVIGGFVSRFTVRFTEQDAEPGLPPGADGLVFVIQDDSDQAIGLPGCGMGYAGIPRSVAVSLDTFGNAPGCGGDPNDNHISVHRGGSIEESDALATEPDLGGIVLEDRRPHDVAVTYFDGVLSVYLDDLALPLLTVPVDLAAELGTADGKAWVGFTAATAFAYQHHDVLDWNLRSVPLTPCGQPVQAEPGQSVVASFDVGSPSGTFILSWAQLGRMRHRVRQGTTILHDTGCTAVTRGTVPVVVRGASSVVTVESRPCVAPQGPYQVTAECMPSDSTEVVTFGADTNSGLSELANAPAFPPAFYIGQLGVPIDSIPGRDRCSITLDPRLGCTDIVTGQACTYACDFEGAVAQQVGPASSYGFWFLRGPGDLNDADPTVPPRRESVLGYARRQADTMIAQARRYSAAVAGRVLFADMEAVDGHPGDRENGIPDEAGWYICTETIPNVCDPNVELNQLLLNEYLERVVEEGYIPGVYANKTFLTRYFPTSYIPRYTRGPNIGKQIPLVLWITSCDARCGPNMPTPVEVANGLPVALESIFLGAQATLWQFYIPGDECGAVAADVDLDATSSNPARGFVPNIPAVLPPDVARKCSPDP